jgi:hypothetical protein
MDQGKEKLSSSRLSRREFLLRGAGALAGLSLGVYTAPKLTTLVVPRAYANVSPVGSPTATPVPSGDGVVPLMSVGEARFTLQREQPSGPSSGLVVMDFNDGVTPERLVDELFGDPSLRQAVGNIHFTGHSENPQLKPQSAGIFTGGSGIIGFERGIILSSGKAKGVVGPNTQSALSNSHGAPGDPDLDALAAPDITNDATVLEFDITPPGGVDVISFQYVLASDEYNQIIVGAFNDVFGFFVDGVNVALLPGTTTPVSINTVHDGNSEALPPIPPENRRFFRRNMDDSESIPGPINTEMDGLTLVLPVEVHVTPGRTTHIKLAIADTADDLIDSNVFIKSGSLIAGPPLDRLEETAQFILPAGRSIAPLNEDVTIELFESLCGGTFSRLFLPAGSFTHEGGQTALFDGAVVDGVTGVAVSATIRITEIAPGAFEVSLHLRNADYLCLKGADHRQVRLTLKIGNDVMSGAQCFERRNGGLLWPPGPGVVCP